MISVLIGYSGHGFVVGDAAISASIDLRFYAERNEVLKNPLNLKYLGFDGDSSFLGFKRNYAFILGIGDNTIRNNVGTRLLSLNEKIINVIHPTASISSSVSMGVGVFISKQVSVNPLVSIDDFVVINTAAVVEHECVIGRSAHIAPGAVLAGNVKVGHGTFIGANAVVKQGVVIGNNVIIGAGAVVLNNVPDFTSIVGNPAKKIL
jgi:sugar O-acyltransferase (sialic acid O-acetyltransferase NeuD family)